MRPGWVIWYLHAFSTACLAVPSVSSPTIEEPTPKVKRNLGIDPSQWAQFFEGPKSSALILATGSLIGAQVWFRNHLRRLHGGRDPTAAELKNWLATFSIRRKPDVRKERLHLTRRLERRAQMAAKIDQVELLRYLRAYRSQTFYTFRPQKRVTGARWRIDFERDGTPSFFFPQDDENFVFCAQLSSIPLAGNFPEWPYHTLEQWTRMEKCVFYAMDLLTLEEMLSNRPLDEHVESWRRAKEQEKGAEDKGPDTSAFSVDNPLKAIRRPQGASAEAALQKVRNGVHKSAIVAGTMAGQMVRQARLPKASVLKIPALHP